MCSGRKMMCFMRPMMCSVRPMMCSVSVTIGIRKNVPKKEEKPE